ncbi:MAG: hypothetical protein WD751_07335 [Anaerolineales bacterium]
MCKQQKRQVFLGTVIFLSVILAACSGGTSLVGKWEAAEETSGIRFTFEFKSNGELEMGVEGVTITGTYEMVDANTFTMSIEMLGQSQTESVDFVRSGNSLTLTIAGDALDFTKVP